MSDKRLSIFIDESGDFGAYEKHAPYYLVTMVFHNQDAEIHESIKAFDAKVAQAGLEKRTIHVGPLIRREQDYFNDDRVTRKKIFSMLYHFTRSIDIHYSTICIEKRKDIPPGELATKIFEQIKACLVRNVALLNKYDEIIIYYDNGQKELKRAFVLAFKDLLAKITIRKVRPQNYILFQIADLICTLELIALKFMRGQASHSEEDFFKSKRNFMKDFMRGLLKMRI